MWIKQTNVSKDKYFTRLQREHFLDFSLYLKRLQHEPPTLPWQPPRTKTTSSLRVDNKDGSLVCEFFHHLWKINCWCPLTKFLLQIRASPVLGNVFPDTVWYTSARSWYEMKSDVDELMPRLLPIEFGAGTENLELNGPPRNPQEYLRQVQ